MGPNSRLLQIENMQGFIECKNEKKKFPFFGLKVIILCTCTIILFISYNTEYIVLRTVGNNCCCYNDSTKIWPKSSAQNFL